LRIFEYTVAVNRKPQIAAGQLDALRKFKADVFQVLAHPTRIHIIETLREGELSVGAILEHVKVEPANISQHLALLRSKGLVTNRKDKNQVLYSLRDPLLIEVLDIMRRYFLAHLEEALGILHGLEASTMLRPRRTRTGRRSLIASA
jgi:DNA-binding transcriptional ArsR family regulator